MSSAIPPKALAAVVTCLCMACFLSAARPAWPQNDVDANVLWEQATLYRDEWGVPHVFADNVRAMAFAFGYGQAQDHLREMLVAYRIVNGRAAEIFGESYALSDEFALKMGHGALAQRALREADPITVDLCEGFALGVNTWLLDHVDEAPSWAEGMSPHDVLALLHGYLLSMAPFDLPDVYSPSPGTPTANAWAVGPQKSQSGNAMLVINPHGDYYGPFRWYEAHLVAPGLNVAGATLFGLPFILQGHNESLGWALSPNKADFADIYADSTPKLAQNPKSVMVNQEKNLRMAMLLQELSYRKAYYVRTADGMEKRYVRALLSQRGPVIDVQGGRNLTYKVGGYWNFGALRQFVEMARAKNLEQFKEALALHEVPTFNIVYADRRGNIFYLYNTKVGVKALRAAGSGLPGGALQDYDWTRPLDGADDTYTWGATIPPSALPSVSNPASGYIQACGSPPWLTTENAGINPLDWPAWLIGDEDSLRAARVRQLMSLGERSFYDCQSMLYDLVVPAAVDTIPVLLAAAEAYPGFVAGAHPDLAPSLEMLAKWNFLADTRSEAMTFFHVWWTTLSAQTASIFLSERQLYDALIENTPVAQQYALNAGDETARLIRNAYQTTAPRWGDVHTIHRGERAEEMRGAVTGGPIFLSSDRAFSRGGWSVNYGYDFAMVIEFGDRPQAVSMVPFGASENPDSPHYDDQLDLMLDSRFKTTRYETEDVQRHAHSATGKVITLRPEGSRGQFIIRSARPVEARLTTSSYTPLFLPDGLTAYTEFMEMEMVPRTARVAVDMELYVPEALCTLEALSTLAIYGFDEESGWYALETQIVDGPNRALVGRDFSTNNLYAVLGPEEYLLMEPTSVSGTKIASRPSFVPRPPAARVVEEGAPRAEGPSSFRLSTGAILNGGAPPAGENGGADTEAVDGETRDGGEGPVAKPRRFSFKVLDESPLRNLSDEDKTHYLHKSQTGKRQFFFERLDGAEEEEGTTGEEKPQEENAILRPTLVRDPATIAQTSRTGGIKIAKGAPPDPLAPADPARSTPRFIGPELELRPPVGEGLFRLIAPRSIRAGIDWLESTPGPLPEGMAVYSPILKIAHMPRGIPGTAAMTLKLPAGVCAPKHYDALALYVYEEEKGWRPLKGFKFNADSRSFSAIDDAFRTYAILGPAEYRLGPKNSR